MKTKFRSTVEQIRSEKAEALPAAIVTGIVSSIILLGLAGVTATVVTQQKDAELVSEVTTTATNIDVALRSDASAATMIRPLSDSSVEFHVPSDKAGTQDCKVVTWRVNNNELQRQLTIYSGSRNYERAIGCNTSTAVVTDNTRLLTNALVTEAGNDFHKFSYYNALDRQLLVDNAGTVSALPGTPPQSSADVTAAWASTKVAKIAFKFQLDGGAEGTADDLIREIEQSASTPLYGSPQEKDEATTDAENAVRPDPADNVRLTVSSTSNSLVNPVVLGDDYTVRWNPVTCPTGTERTYIVNETTNNDSENFATKDSHIVREQTNESVTFVRYTTTVNCVRGELSISSEPATAAQVSVVPPAPSVRLTSQPAATNAALTSQVAAEISCDFGTARYRLLRTAGTIDNNSPVVTPQNKATILTRSNAAEVDPDLRLTEAPGAPTVREGARYTYNYTADCITNRNIASNMTSAATNSFVTVLNAPATPSFTYPAGSQMKVETNTNIQWTASTCLTGTATQYQLRKDRNYDQMITQQTVQAFGTGGTANNRTVSNTEGNRVGYNVIARCEGSAGGTADSSQTGLPFTTLVNAPSAVRNLHTNRFFEMWWDQPATTCATGTTLRYRIHQTKANNGNVDLRTGWNTINHFDTPHGDRREGHPQWASVETICDGVNDDSDITESNTYKWISDINVSMNAGVHYFRRFLADAHCGYGTTASTFNAYIAADGFNPTWGSRSRILPGGHWATTSRHPVAGGNTGWMRFSVNQNRHTQLFDNSDNQYSHWEGLGRSNWATRTHDGGRRMELYYYNMSSFSDNITFWWYGTCTTPYAQKTSKGQGYWGYGNQQGGGNPWAEYNNVDTSLRNTTTGNNAIR